MQFRPNDLPDMELNEVRNVVFNLAGAIGANTISGTPTCTSPNLTFGSVTSSGANITVPVTAAQVGVHMVKLSAVLSSSETLVGVARVKVIDSTRETNANDY